MINTPKHRIGLIFLLIILMLNGLSVFGQDAAERFAKQWELMMQQDDYEKDYRFANFLDSALTAFSELPAKELHSGIPSGWSYAETANRGFVVVAALMRFQSAPDRLVLMVRDSVDTAKDYVFVEQLDAVAKPSENLHLSIEEYKLGDGEFSSLSYGTDAGAIFSIPDIRAKILIENLGVNAEDSLKISLSEDLWCRMALLLEYKPLFDNPFAGFKNISTLISSDGVIKIVSWNIEFENGTNAFYGGFAVRRDDSIRVYPLIDNYLNISSPETASLSMSRWYGAVYYEILVHRYKKNTYYTLLGYNPNNRFSKIRVIESLGLASNGMPRFGQAIIDLNGKSYKRKIFEYSNRVSMMLRYDSEEKMIVMDNLAPASPLFENDFRQYGPDFTHNALKFEKGKWVFYSDIILKNPAPRR